MKPHNYTKYLEALKPVDLITTCHNKHVYNAVIHTIDDSGKIYLKLPSLKIDTGEKFKIKSICEQGIYFVDVEFVEAILDRTVYYVFRCADDGELHQRRNSYRVAVDFPVTFRIAGDDSKTNHNAVMADLCEEGARLYTKVKLELMQDIYICFKSDVKTELIIIKAAVRNITAMNESMIQYGVQFSNILPHEAKLINKIIISGQMQKNKIARSHRK